MPPSTLVLSRPDFEPPLAAELARLAPSAAVRRVSPSWWEWAVRGEELPGRAVAFARQVLPHAEPLVAESIRLWAEMLCDRLLDRLRDHAGPWRLQIFPVEVPGGTAGRRRCGLIEAAVLDRLKRKRKSLLALRIPEPAEPDLPPAPREPAEALVQVALRTAAEGACSLLLPAERAPWDVALSLVAGGDFPWIEDKAAPSRAFAKVVEAEAQAGFRFVPGETCVDLGASPGGWTWVAVQRGARVIAVDRSPLREDLMRHPRVTFVKGDAFEYRPDKPVDRLLCDLIAAPERTFELLRTWLTAGLCREFLVTVKFRGDADYGRLADFERLLAETCSRYFLRRLGVNKNEATLVGTRRVEPRTGESKISATDCAPEL